MIEPKIKKLIQILSQNVESYSSEEVKQIEDLKNEIFPHLDEDYVDYISSRYLYVKVEEKPVEIDDLPF
jgi:hypothetical protein